MKLVSCALHTSNYYILYTTNYFVHEMAMKMGNLHESVHETSFMHNYVLMKDV